MFDVFSIFYVALNEQHRLFFVNIAPRLITPGQVPASGRSSQVSDKNPLRKPFYPLVPLSSLLP
jgi:hypothetical protein